MYQIRNKVRQKATKIKMLFKQQSMQWTYKMKINDHKL